MITMYERILPQIVSEFKIANENNIELIQRMNIGFSGAEVYTIELKSPSMRTGKFFLKIDEKNNELHNSNISHKFPYAVEYIDMAIIDGLCVLLIQIAGGSSFRYKSFFTSSVSTKKSMTTTVIKGMLECSLNKNSFHPSKMPLHEICSKVLAHKVSGEGPINDFLKNHLAKPEASLINLRGDVLPNAFYFARHECHLTKTYYLDATVHGDFHGENVFLHQDGKDDYAIIDWAYASEEGFLFYDSAYFELSLLLHSLENCSLKKWVDTVKDIYNEKWENLEFKDKTVIESIHKTETQWIDTVNSTCFSHTDKMICGRYIARVLAGLNFAGKMKIDYEKKEKAFMFSCISLKKLFELAKCDELYNNSTDNWNSTVLVSDPNPNAILGLAKHCTYFSEQYKYILIRGSSPVPTESVNEYLTRIPWTGIISLSSKLNDSLYTKVNKVKLIRNLLPSQTISDIENNIQHGAIWWMFANGFESDPSTIISQFPQWRNKYNSFLQNAITKIYSSSSPQDLMLIIDCVSFETADEWDKVQLILEWFDQSESADIVASVLASDDKKGFDNNRLANITLESFDIKIQDLAYYASSHLSGGRKNGICLPHIHKRMGVLLEEDDEKYITSYLEVIGDHLLNNVADNKETRAFYWGEDITWDAIDNNILIDRHEIHSLTEKIKKTISDEKWGHISLGHTPGAGASILSKSVCWKLRNQYPTVQIKQINIDLFESIKRIADITGKPILILADEDFTRNDIDMIESKLKSYLVKCVILYTFRVYEEKLDNQSSILTSMDIQTSEKFEFRYGDEMQMRGRYSEEQLESRKQQLYNLTHHVNLAEFRLPFFYGMYAFEDDFVSISKYTSQIIDCMNNNPEYCKIVSYIAIITYFTATNGLSHKVARKILNMPNASIKKMLNTINTRVSNFVYVTNCTYRICHPLIAYKILITQFGANNSSLSTLSFSNLCKEFIKDIRLLEGGENPSDYASKLITDIFVTREFADSTDSPKYNSKDTLNRKSFAYIILVIDNENLQKEIFSCLVKHFPDNPHCFQHYGRILIFNTPSDINAAKQQFDLAIKLDDKNPLHYHARGTMYYKHCKYLVTSKYRDVESPMEVYNGCKHIVEQALQDFEKVADIALRNNQDSQTENLLLSYPYSSILNTCTLIIRTIIEKYGLKYDTKQFWNMETDVTRWCRNLLAIANKYDFKTENVHPEIIENSFYCAAKQNLMKIRLDSVEIQELITQNPDENSLKIIYLGCIDTCRDALKKKTQKELLTICNYCEEIISTSEMDDGVVWKWFNAYIRMDNFDYTHALGLLETLPNKEINITANYLLYIIYFCKFLKTNDRNDADSALLYLKYCNELSRHDQYRRSSRCFLTSSGIVQLTTTKEAAAKFPCKIVDEVTTEQSAKMSLDIDARFKVFFVPYHNKVIKIGQSFNQAVNATIGFSYSGLRGFDLELR